MNGFLSVVSFNAMINLARMIYVNQYHVFVNIWNIYSLQLCKHLVAKFSRPKFKATYDEMR